MFDKKQKCNICGNRFKLTKDIVYTAQEQQTLSDIISLKVVTFSAVDCPKCGCQIPLAVRVPKVEKGEGNE